MKGVMFWHLYKPQCLGIIYCNEFASLLNCVSSNEDVQDEKWISGPNFIDQSKVYSSIL